MIKIDDNYFKKYVDSKSTYSSVYKEYSDIKECIQKDAQVLQLVVKEVY